MYLLDTNICIYAIKKKPASVLERIHERFGLGLFISALTVAELEYGIENSSKIEENRIALLKFLSLFTVLPFEDEDAIPYGKLKSKLKKEGRIIGPIDMLLAAQAISRDFALVTNNTKEFERIEHIKLENWVE
jgi:tRNA(fMet)-specific endonuclease VapC